ncbi:2-oxoglutarate and iron-dependent oxygenase domain-containing protein [Halopseudomonas pachastrellae]|nr:2-oxoglutarate and iron-dependent oxygenase domain-containing protein [Halopseudomonas pachastrellae]
MAATLREACEHSGFFYVSGHGIDSALIEQVFNASKQFFDLPMTDKLLVDKAQSKANRGYEPLRGQTLEAGAPPDLKEGFYIGEEVAADDERALTRFNTGQTSGRTASRTFAPRWSSTTRQWRR